MMHPSATDTVRAAARAAYPQECCGLLLGRMRGLQAAEVVRAVPVPNVAADPERSYEIDPADLLAVETQAAGAGLQVVGAFHSHPGGRASPSARDGSMATPGWTYAVAAGVADAEPEVRWFRLDAAGKRLEELPTPAQR